MGYSATSNSPSFPNAQPFVGIVENTIHALRLVQAAKQGLIPRVIRRLNDSERREMITSGAVFVFGVEESGIKRWTDSLVWSPSRIVNNFLVYKQMCEKSGGRASQKRNAPGEQGAQSAQRSSHQGSAVGGEGSFVATSISGPLKVNGLIKKTITVTIDGSDLHLISYYTQEDLQSRRLRRISSRPDIANLVLQPHLFRLSSFRNPPKVVFGRDGVKDIVCEPEDPAEPLEDFIAESPYPTSYSPDWPGVTAEDVSQQGLAASSLPESFVRGHSATTWFVPTPQFRQHGLQGQPDMTPLEDRRQLHWPSAIPMEMQRGHDHIVHRRIGAEYDSHLQQQQRWPPSSQSFTPARYDSTTPPSSSYPHRSHGAESEKDTRSGGQTLITTMTDEHAFMYENNSYYIVDQDRHVGYDQPTWLPTNQIAATQNSQSGIQNSYSSRRPSSSNFPLIHSPGNTDAMWSSNRNTGGSYEFQYPELGSAHNFYSS